VQAETANLLVSHLLHALSWRIQSMLFQGSDCLLTEDLVRRWLSDQLIDFYAESTSPHRQVALGEMTAVFHRSLLVLVAPFDEESEFALMDCPSIQPKRRQADVYLPFELV